MNYYVHNYVNVLVSNEIDEKIIVKKKGKKLKNNDIKWQTNKMPTLICPVSWIIVDIKH